MKKKNYDFAQAVNARIQAALKERNDDAEIERIQRMKESDSWATRLAGELSFVEWEQRRRREEEEELLKLEKESALEEIERRKEELLQGGDTYL